VTVRPANLIDAAGLTALIASLPGDGVDAADLI
jgi:hypothetical protein